MAGDVQGLAYTLLGVLVGVIFILDGWRSSSEDTGWLQSSPKIRGLLFVLGAGIIPAIQAVLGKDQRVLSIYALAFVATSLALLAGMAFYALLVTYKRLADVRSSWTRGEREPQFQALVARAVLQVTASPDQAELVLCIDAAEPFRPDPLRYRTRMIMVMCLLLAYARATLGITTEALAGACQSSPRITQPNASAAADDATAPPVLDDPEAGSSSSEN